jgi:hypothetical protein
MASFRLFANSALLGGLALAGPAALARVKPFVPALADVHLPAIDAPQAAMVALACAAVLTVIGEGRSRRA